MNLGTKCVHFWGEILMLLCTEILIKRRSESLADSATDEPTVTTVTVRLSDILNSPIRRPGPGCVHIMKEKSRVAQVLLKDSKPPDQGRNHHESCQAQPRQQ